MSHSESRSPHYLYSMPVSCINDQTEKCSWVQVMGSDTSVPRKQALVQDIIVKMHCLSQVSSLLDPSMPYVVLQSMIIWQPLKNALYFQWWIQTKCLSPLPPCQALETCAGAILHSQVETLQGLRCRRQIFMIYSIAGLRCNSCAGFRLRRGAPGCLELRSVRGRFQEGL